MSQIDCCAAAHEPATQAITSTRKRRPDEIGVSYGCLNADGLLT